MIHCIGCHFYSFVVLVQQSSFQYRIRLLHAAPFLACSHLYSYLCSHLLPHLFLFFTPFPFSPLYCLFPPCSFHFFRSPTPLFPLFPHFPHFFLFPTALMQRQRMLLFLHSSIISILLQLFFTVQSRDVVHFFHFSFFFLLFFHGFFHGLFLFELQQFGFLLFFSNFNQTQCFHMFSFSIHFIHSNSFNLCQSFSFDLGVFQSFLFNPIIKFLLFFVLQFFPDFQPPFTCVLGPFLFLFGDLFPSLVSQPRRRLGTLFQFPHGVGSFVFAFAKTVAALVKQNRGQFHHRQLIFVIHGMPVFNDFRHGRCQYHPTIPVSSNFTAHKAMKHFLNFNGCSQSSSSYLVDETIFNIDFDRLTSIPCLNQLDRPQFSLFSFNKYDFTYNDRTCF